MAINFTAIDFETANRNTASACAVGLVQVRDGRVTQKAEWLIRPDAILGDFDPFNIKIHGITPGMVEDAPTWEEQFADLIEFIGGDIVVAHNAGFDMGVIKAACKIHALNPPKVQYLCSLKVSRKTFDIPSHSLPFAAKAAGFGEFQHHDALADALACAQIINGAAEVHEQESVQQLAKTLGLNLATLKPGKPK